MLLYTFKKIDPFTRQQGYDSLFPIPPLTNDASPLFEFAAHVKGAHTGDMNVENFFYGLGCINIFIIFT